MNTKIRISVGCMAGLLLMMLLTEPSDLHPIMLTIPFLAVFICLFLLFYSLFRVKHSSSRSAWTAFTISSLPVVLLALQSLGQLGLGDVLTLIVLYGILYLYMSRVVVSD